MFCFFIFYFYSDRFITNQTKEQGTENQRIQGIITLSLPVVYVLVTVVFDNFIFRRRSVEVAKGANAFVTSPLKQTSWYRDNENMDIYQCSIITKTIFLRSRDCILSNISH